MLEVKNLCRNYGSFEAVKDLSFSAGPVEVLGFLGPNGAGKTTVMKAITGCHYPSSGDVFINGFSIKEEPEEAKNFIGYLSEKNPLYTDHTPYEYLDFTASARLLSGQEKQKAIERVLSLCNLEEHCRRPIEHLSRGLRQRLGFAQAIIHDPPLLIFDEPGSGLDPNQIMDFRKLIRELGKTKTIVLSTHILNEVEALCSRILILNKGRMLIEGTKKEILESLGMNSEEHSLEDIFARLTKEGDE